MNQVIFLTFSSKRPTVMVSAFTVTCYRPAWPRTKLRVKTKLRLWKWPPLANGSKWNSVVPRRGLFSCIKLS